MRRILVLIVVGFVTMAVAAGPARAQLVTTDLSTPTPPDLANALVGTGVTVSNVTYTGAPVAAGTFTGGSGIIGFDAGVILSSGAINNTVGPNVLDNITAVHGTAGDADLTSLSGFATNDASVLEFDFVPDADRVFFRYVFSSDEYNEFVNTSYNDVFAFFVNGTNCAVVGSQPVSINTINNGNPLGTNPTNPGLYLNNDVSDGGGSLNTEMDGLTVVLTCEAGVMPNVTNHMKLAIADASDSILDSNVFIEAGSLTTTPGKLTVIKHVVNDNGGTAVPGNFTMTVTGQDPSPSSFPGADLPGTDVALKPGTYSVSESGPNGYTVSLSGDCSGTIASTESKTCTITNDDVPPTAECAGEAATIVGTAGADAIVGTPGRDVVQALDGDDRVSALGGNDLICGGDGDDDLHGGTGRDRLYGDDGDDELFAGSGNDRLFGGPGEDGLRGGTGNDGLSGGGGDDDLRGNNGDDRLSGGRGHDELSGGRGDDRLSGGPGDDELSGDSGDDRVDGGPGDDELSGDSGTDRLDGAPGTNQSNGGAGADDCVNPDTAAGAVNCETP